MNRLVPGLAVSAFAALGALVAGACAQSGTVIGITPITALAVEPAEFLGSMHCGDAPGEIQTYVATVYDVSDLRPLHAGEDEMALPSSAPTQCFQTLYFQRIVTGRQYAAQIDAYDRSDVHPHAPGSRIMVDGAGAYVAPRWQTSCSPPVDRAKTAAGDAGILDASPAAAPTPGRITVGERPDAAGPAYYDCRGAKYPDGGAYPWLRGPVCALAFDTIPFSGCDALHEVASGASAP